MLSNRLEEIINQICESDCLCDVGTDHGYVPIEAVRRGKCKKAIASDINQGPVEKVKLNIKLEGYEDCISAVKSDGLKEIEKNSFDQLVIAGMGGELIARILEDGRDKLAGIKQMILQPMTHENVLREYLILNGFFVRSEVLSKDNTGKIYVILVAESPNAFTKRNIASLEDVLIGPIMKNQRTELSREYVSNILKKKQRKLKGVSSSNNPNPEEISVLEKSIEICMDTIKLHDLK